MVQTKDENFIVSLMLHAEDSAQAFNALFTHYKDKNPKLTFGHFCRKCGIESTGLLSDALKGRRHLPTKYVAAISRFFELSDLQKEIFLFLVKVDRSKNPEQRRELKQKLSRLRETLDVNRRIPESTSADQLLLMVEIFSFLGVRSSTTLKNLLPTFSDYSAHAIQSAVDALVKMKVVEETRDHIFKPISKTLFLHDVSKKIGFENVITASLERAQKALQKNLNPAAVHFETGCLSIKKDKISEFLNAFREMTSHLIESSEDLNGDTVVRFNFQIFQTI